MEELGIDEEAMEDESQPTEESKPLAPKETPSKKRNLIKSSVVSEQAPIHKLAGASSRNRKRKEDAAKFIKPSPIKNCHICKIIYASKEDHKYRQENDKDSWKWIGCDTPGCDVSDHTKCCFPDRLKKRLSNKDKQAMHFRCPAHGANTNSFQIIAESFKTLFESFRKYYRYIH